MSQTIFLIIDIVAFVIGLLLVVISFLTYTRKGESEISRDVLLTPRFIIGVVLIVVAAILGVVV